MSHYRYQVLEQTLRRQLSTGRYQPGDRLPSIRALCSEHQMSKATVIHALHRLEAAQLIFALPKSGYFVRSPVAETFKPARVDTPKHPAPVSVPAIFRDIMDRSAAFDILPEANLQQDDTSLILLNRLVGRSVRHKPQQKAGYYDEPAGRLSLRQALVSHLRQRHLSVEPQALCVTSGCQHSLFIALMITCQPGDTVAVESPAFYGVLQIMEQLRLNIIEIASDAATGLDVDELQSKLADWPVKACVVSPNFGTPTGALMPQEARKRLLHLARKHRFWLIEDDIYGDLSLCASPPAPLKALDNPEDERVILCASLSKSLSRDLRLGWICAGPLQERAVQLKLITQLASSQAIQEGLADFISEGHYRRHLSRYCQHLREYKAQLLARLSRYTALGVRFSQPEGGLCIWVQLPETCNTQEAYRSLRDKGVLLTPGTLFSANGLYPNYLRLSFAHPVTPERQRALGLLFGTLLQ